MRERKAGPPEGFVPLDRKGAFSIHNGPFFHRPGSDDLIEHAFLASAQHANGLGVAHGGMLSTFLDGLLAAAVVRKAARPAVTVHLSIDFLHMARVGEWIHGEGRLTRLTPELAFAEGRAFVGRRDVARASGIFKLMSTPRGG